MQQQEVFSPPTPTIITQKLTNMLPRRIISPGPPTHTVHGSYFDVGQNDLMMYMSQSNHSSYMDL